MRKVWVKATMVDIIHLELEEGFKNALLERQSEVDVTTTVGEESGRLPPRTPIDWTPLPIKT